MHLFRITISRKKTLSGKAAKTYFMLYDIPAPGLQDYDLKKIMSDIF